MTDLGLGGRRTMPGSGGSDLGRRILSGLVLAVAALAAAWAGGPVFAAFWLAAGIAVALEWITITGAEPKAILVALCAAGLGGLLVAYKLDSDLPVGLAVVGLAAVAIVFASEGARDRSWAVAGFGYALVVAFVPTVVRDRPDLGAVAILWIFGVVWTTDIAAYFAGRALGGPRLAPRISPKKTWSGFLGGLLAATLVGTLVVHFGTAFGTTLPFGSFAAGVASAIASVASQVGDLGESAMKRRFDVKDSGHLIPGHGGVMDRLDGFAAVALLCGVALAGSRLTR